MMLETAMPHGAFATHFEHCCGFKKDKTINRDIHARTDPTSGQTKADLCIRNLHTPQHTRRLLSSKGGAVTETLERGSPTTVEKLASGELTLLSGSASKKERSTTLARAADIRF